MTEWPAGEAMFCDSGPAVRSRRMWLPKPQGATFNTRCLRPARTCFAAPAVATVPGNYLALTGISRGRTSGFCGMVTVRMPFLYSALM
ncbi:MAG: hypothetical protein H6Q05_532 [Acidobacteria bacterium]|nr:hypothetical protein [Acidobacteriota bacterium]